MTGMERFGVTSMVAPLRRVLLRRPSTSGDFAAANWRQPDPVLLARQHEQLCSLLADLGWEAEPPLLGAAFEAAGVPVVARLTGGARADGGDIIWLDHRTVLVGRSYRTNAEGVRQLREILAPQHVWVDSVHMPHDQGPGHVLHLMSVISPIADDLAVVYPPLTPVPLMEELAVRGVRIVPVPPEEYETMAGNVLPVRPGVAVMLDGNPQTRKALEGAGCEVHVYDGSEISLKGDGGPTCLTQPLLRSSA